MPVNQKKMNALKQQYGNQAGERVYFAMETKEKKRKKARRSRKASRKSSKANR